MSEAISAYRHVAASPEFSMRSKAGHDEAQALMNARRKEREHWQGVVAEQAARISELEALLGERK